MCRGSTCCRRSSAMRARTNGCRASRLSARSPSNGRSRAAKSIRSTGSGTAVASSSAISGEVHAQLGEARRELGPGQPHPVRVAAEQLVVPAPGDLLGHQRPDLVAQPHRLAAGDQGVDRVGTEETGQRRPAGAQLVVRLGVVGRPPRRAHDQPRLGPRRQVPQLVAVRLEAPAAALEQQHQEVDEGQSHAADQHRLPRREDRQVGVGGLLWRQVAQPVRRRPARPARARPRSGSRPGVRRRAPPRPPAAAGRRAAAPAARRRPR